MPIEADALRIRDRLQGQVIPAVPVPFRGRQLALDAQRSYAHWMAQQPAGGVAVWAHTGRGPRLSRDDRLQVLGTWREALRDRLVVAGAVDASMAREARTHGADALLAFPQPQDPVGYHAALGAELPVIAFYLYEAAGGVSYDDATLHAILQLPSVVGIKVATLDSVMTYQRIAALVAKHPDKLLITGEDRFLGYSIMIGARAALIGMAAAVTRTQCRLLQGWLAGDHATFHRLSERCDRLAQATFVAPMEGYIRRMLWAAAEEGAIPRDCCDDPWGPPLDPSERSRVEAAVRDARTVAA